MTSVPTRQGLNLSKYSDVLVALAVIMVVGMMIIPVPPLLLDILLSLNLTLSLIILLVAMYTQETLQFSIFPSLLLITTLFRLSLNVSSTRLILLRGEPGSVIVAFGDFVVGGNAVVGFIIFLILVVIQFVVITRGAERVSEVAARFTLDAMPGKQMAIDADLNSGLVTETDARARRKAIEQEADFYGAMDGASKFVKGDAIAGIIITGVNLVGGFIMGSLSGMDFTESLRRYSLLTVGDGLVTQIPALLISTATGIVVTRAASEGNLGEDLVGQLLRQPRVMFLAGGVMALMAAVPGMPRIPFLTLALLVGGLGYILTRSAAASPIHATETGPAEDESKKPENVTSLLQVDPLEVELGYGLLGLADRGAGGDLMDRIVMIRRQTAVDLGLVLPYIRVRDNMQLKPNQYVIKLKGIEVGSGELLPDHFLAMNPGGADEAVPGIATTEPAFGLPALWVSSPDREHAEMAGYTVVDPAAVLATHLTEVIRSYAYELLGRQEVSGLVETVKGSHPAVIEELVPRAMTLGEIQKVLQNLLREGVSIRDLVTIFETLADYAPATKDFDLLTEYVRSALARSIARQYGLGKGKLRVITLHPDFENQIARAVERRDGGTYFNLEPHFLQRALTSLSGSIQKASSAGHPPIVLTSPSVRPYFKRLTERVAPRLIVLSYNELEPDAEIESVGMVTA